MFNNDQIYKVQVIYKFDVVHYIRVWVFIDNACKWRELKLVMWVVMVKLIVMNCKGMWGKTEIAQMTVQIILEVKKNWR